MGVDVNNGWFLMEDGALNKVIEMVNAFCFCGVLLVLLKVGLPSLGLAFTVYNRTRKGHHLIIGWTSLSKTSPQ